MSCVDKLINKGWTERQAGKHLCGGEKEDGQEGVRMVGMERMKPRAGLGSHVIRMLSAQLIFFFSEMKTLMSTTTGL